MSLDKGFRLKLFILSNRGLSFFAMMKGAVRLATKAASSSYSYPLHRIRPLCRIRALRRIAKGCEALAQGVLPMMLFT